MSCKYVLSIFFLLSPLIFNANAQDTTDFFPHKVGDHWEYRYADDWSIEKVLTIEKDSTDNAGNTFIKYLQEPYYSVRIDSLNNVFEWDGFFQEDIGLWYKLTGNVGDRWDVSENIFIGNTTKAHIVDLFSGLVFFNIPATIVQIDYWWDFWDTPEDDSFWVETRYLADGFGFVEREFEPGGVAFAAGAIIDSVQYGILMGLDEQNNIPNEMTLAQNYPNPFNSSTIIEYQISTSAMVVLSVYNSIGQNIATLVNEHQKPARYKVRFNPVSLSSGVYFYRLNFNGNSLTKKMLLLQ